MRDELMEELDNVLNVDRNKSKDVKNKLHSYFGNDADKDDLFEHICVAERDLNDSYKNLVICNKDGEEKEKIDTVFNDIENESLNNLVKTVGSAWLNSENTKNILVKIISKDIIPSQVNKSLLARPQLYTDSNQKLIDPIFSLLSENYGHETAAELRHLPSIDDWSLTEKEVLSLIEKGWIRPAIDLTSKILNKMGFTFSKSLSVESTSSNFTIESGRLWCLRFTLLSRMKLYSILELELSGFQNLDSPNLYKEFYSDVNNVSSKGSLIPFSMRLIYAELPMYFNKFSEALNRLYYLLAVIKRIIINIQSGYSEDGMNLCQVKTVQSNAMKIWEKRKFRVIISCMRILIASKDYPSVIDIIHDLINMSDLTNFMDYTKDNLYHLLGRIYLQLGDIDNAVFYFEQSIKALTKTLEFDINYVHGSDSNIIKTKISFQNALINISRSNYEEAKKCFQFCLEIIPNNTLILNNYSVCCLYLKQVQEAICILEKLLQRGIRNDGIIFNLCILYELQTNQIKSKKLKIVKSLAQFPGDDFNIASFKLSNME